MREVGVSTADGLALTAWYQPPRNPGGRVIVYFHGNAGHHAHRAGKIVHFIEAGYGVYLCGYRGYGGNPGRPSEEGFYSDARAGIEWLRQQGISARQMVFYGESIGGGVAVQMAAETAPPVLILEAPFTNVSDMARRRYNWLPVDFLVRDRFDNLAKIGGLKTDLLIVHGDEDLTTPIALAQQLFEAAKHPKEFITINRGGHSDLYEHHAGHVIVDWLKKRDGERAQ
jgi:fermentation-respiration switch protein FrsA (DUF1100 family)